MCKSFKGSCDLKSFKISTAFDVWFSRYRPSNLLPVTVSALVLVFTLQWRHNGHDSVSNHQPHDCLLNRLFRLRSKKTLKLRVTGLCAGKSSETCEFPAQMASNAENVSVWWRHRDKLFVDGVHPHLLPHIGLIQGLRPANERRRYTITSYLVGWVQT